MTMCCCSFPLTSMNTQPDRTDSIDPIPDALRQLATLRAKGNSAEALALVEATLADHPDDLRLQVERAAVLRLARRYDDCIATCRQVLQHAPQRRMAMIIIVEALLDAGDPQGACDASAMALQAHPGDPLALILMADAQARLGHFTDAQASLTLALKDHPGNRRAHEVMARIAIATGDHASAIIALQALLESAPNHPERLRQLAMAQRGAGDLSQSCQTCLRLLALDPQHRAAHLILTDNLLMQQDYDGAAQIIDRWLAVRPGDTVFHQRRLRQLRQSQQLDKARDILAAMPPELAGDRAIIAERVQCLRQGGDLDGALSICRDVVAQDADDANSRALLADLLIQSRRFAEAETVLAGLCRDHPDHATYLARRAMCLRRTGRVRDAAALVDERLTSDPRQTTLLVEQAVILRWQGDMHGSLAACDMALKVSPDDHAAQITRLDTLLELGDAVSIAAVAQSCGQRLQDDTLPTVTRALLARLICRAAEGLPADQARLLLQRRGTLLLEVAELLPQHTLWRTYLLADQLGLGDEFSPMAARWLAAPHMNVAEARSLLHRMFQFGMPRWQEVAGQLSLRLSALDRLEFDLDRAVLTGSVARALSQRRRAARMVKSPDYALLVARILRQLGRGRTAARYLGVAMRHDPDDAAIFRHLILTLIQCGASDQVRSLLTQAETTRHAPRWIEAIAFGWANLDEPARAATLMHRLDHTRLSAGLSAWYPRILLRLGRMTEARALVVRASDAGSARGINHFRATFQGGLQIESELDHHHSFAGHSLVTPAIRRVDMAPPLADGTAPAETRPRAIIQFWNHRKPPAELRPIMQSWANAEGYSYQRFSQASAGAFLAETLDESWLRAFGRAASPTEQSDFFRLCWLMVNGGIYADCDDWLTGDLDRFLSGTTGLVLLREPEGTIANNFIAAPRGHPCIVWAATAARHALLGRHTDTTWAKTGPGLMTRALAWYLDREVAGNRTPALTLLPLWALGGTVQIHAPLNYKRSGSHWNARAGMVGALNAVMDMAAGLAN